ncbi:methyltransferase [Streptomyces sp. NBC_00490]|uniref:methyltransferase n=1 Tax=Streptomyces sp. NBC_00490 TaxID=2903657 RepID=UPI003FCED49B
MRAGTELLVVERVLPQDEGVPSLAVAWDFHMLCDVGGRKRTEEHYERLPAEAGFEVTACHGLPLGGSLIHVVRGAAM